MFIRGLAGSQHALGRSPPHNCLPEEANLAVLVSGAQLADLNTDDIDKNEYASWVQNMAGELFEDDVGGPGGGKRWCNERSLLRRFGFEQSHLEAVWQRWSEGFEAELPSDPLSQDMELEKAPSERTPAVTEAVVQQRGERRVAGTAAAPCAALSAAAQSAALSAAPEAAVSEDGSGGDRGSFRKGRETPNGSVGCGAPSHKRASVVRKTAEQKALVKVGVHSMVRGGEGGQEAVAHTKPLKVTSRQKRHHKKKQAQRLAPQTNDGHSHGHGRRSTVRTEGTAHDGGGRKSTEVEHHQVVEAGSQVGRQQTHPSEEESEHVCHAHDGGGAVFMAGGASLGLRR